MLDSRTRWGRRAAAVAALVTGASVAVSGSATADNINQQIADDGASLTLVAGSPVSATASIKLVATAMGDPDPGCNIGPGEAPLVLDVTTPAGVTANPDPLTITECATFYTVTFTAGVDAVSGTAKVTILSGPAGGGTYNNNVSIPINVSQPGPVSVGDEEPPPPGDVTAPEIGYTLSPATPDGADGWYTGDVTVDWTVTEAESASSLTTEGCADVNVAADQQATTYTCTATSEGGTASVTTSAVKRDATAPTDITFAGVPSTVVFDDPIGPFGCSAQDATSGLAGCTVTGGGTAVGTHTVTATATDNAGNVAHRSTTYTVLPWTLHGFYAPVDMNGVVNVVKGGSTVPLKFELFSGSRELSATTDVKSFSATRISCDSSASSDDVEFTTAGATSLRYDATAGQFIQNWKVPTGAGACFRVTMTARDNSSLTAIFKVK
ncbi:MAG TPA: PxKF domain-containing protein [Nocardioides sp.]|nr:PxKF domain-containing protein [Nocardioides sp.]